MQNQCSDKNKTIKTILFVIMFEPVQTLQTNKRTTSPVMFAVWKTEIPRHHGSSGPSGALQ